MTSMASFAPKALAAMTTRKGAALAAPIALGLGALLTLTSVPAPAQSPEPAQQAAAAGQGSFSAQQKADIEQIVKDYLLTNPQIMLEVQAALEEKMEKENADRMKVALQTNAAELFRSEKAPIVGNPQGDVTVVEFFDYNCGYCKRGFSELSKVIEADPKIKVVMKELPILSKGSEEAARVALAAKEQDKYWEFHQAMLQHRGQANKASALSIAGKLGLDLEKIKADMDGEAVSAEISRVRDLAQSMGIRGTPHFLVADKSIPGAPENLSDLLNTLIAETRKEGCKVC